MVALVDTRLVDERKALREENRALRAQLFATSWERMVLLALANWQSEIIVDTASKLQALKAMSAVVHNNQI